jgi:protein AFG1
MRTRNLWNSLLAQKQNRDSLELTRVLTDHEQAMQLQSPKGLMLHGEVGTGKSMLIDLFQDCLPSRKKRRWHFNTFMLDTISRLEQIRRSRTMIAGPEATPEENSLLIVARDLIETSPILFLDEFQLPDRAASKILSNLMTSFFQLGGVLIATSNRMPEDLAKAAGMEFDAPVSRHSRLGWSLGGRSGARRDEGPGQKGEFAAFLEVLRARCEVWEMEGKKDYRKLEREDQAQLDAQHEALTDETISSTTVGMVMPLHLPARRMKQQPKIHRRHRLLRCPRTTLSSPRQPKSSTLSPKLLTLLSNVQPHQNIRSRGSQRQSLYTAARSLSLRNTTVWLSSLSKSSVAQLSLLGQQTSSL